MRTIWAQIIDDQLDHRLSEDGYQRFRFQEACLREAAPASEKRLPRPAMGKTMFNISGSLMRVVIWLSPKQ